MKAYRSEVVKLAQSWLGLNEKDGSYKKIIDEYNKYTGKFPRGLKMQYGWAWCACTWSAIAIKLGYTAIMPIEISCQELIKAAQKMGIWVEDDRYTPKTGDGVIYDWDDNGSGDCTGWPDHVGVVESVNESSGYFVVIEGNYQDSVKKRTVSINGKYIRGFITPKYDEEKNLIETTQGNNINAVAHEVIVGKWGNGEERKRQIEAAGYVYDHVQAAVNQILNGKVSEASNNDQNQPIQKRVTASCKHEYTMIKYKGKYKTTANLYCRNDAGSNKKALCKIPKGSVVTCNKGYYSRYAGRVWLLVTVVLNGTEYTGFSSMDYLQKQ